MVVGRCLDTVFCVCGSPSEWTAGRTVKTIMPGSGSLPGSGIVGQFSRLPVSLLAKSK